jgi:hypothetical protein
MRRVRTRDTALLSVAFDTSARLVGVRARDGASTITLTTASQFGAAIVRAPAGDVWSERIFDPEVRIDGDVAQVWAYFTFHRNKEFSHCGVDPFMLRSSAPSGRSRSCPTPGGRPTARILSRPADSVI